MKYFNFLVLSVYGQYDMMILILQIIISRELIA